MAAKSPTSLNTSRNIALRKGTLSGGFADPEMKGFPPMKGDDNKPLNRPDPSPNGPDPL